MSFETLKTEVQALSADARRKLMAFMVALQDESREGYAAKLAAKTDDTSSDRWLTAEQCEQGLDPFRWLQMSDARLLINIEVCP